MGVTAGGLHYPEPTDRVTDGAAAMQTLANDLQTALYGGSKTLQPRLVRVKNGTSTLGGSQLSIEPEAAGVMGLVVAAFAGQTADLIRVQDSTGAAQMGISGQGFLWVASNPGGLVGLGITNPVHRALVIRAAAGQTANLIEIQDSAAALMARLDKAGLLYTQGLSVSNAPNTGASLFLQLPAGQAAGVAGLLVRDSGGADLFRIMPTGATFQQVNAATAIASIIKAAAAQTADLMQMQNSAATPLVRVLNTGVLACMQSDGATVGVALHPDIAGDPNPARIDVRAGTAGTRLIVGQLAASQTVDALQVNNSAVVKVAAITNTGNVQGTGAYTALSDVTAKENVTDLQLDPVDVIRQLRPVHFDYIDGEADQVGFVAQEVAQVLPHAVVTFDDDGRLGTRDGAVVAYLTGALQVALDRIDQLTARVEALETAQGITPDSPR